MMIKGRPDAVEGNCGMIMIFVFCQAVHIAHIFEETPSLLVQ